MVRREEEELVDVHIRLYIDDYDKLKSRFSDQNMASAIRRIVRRWLREMEDYEDGR